MSIANLKSIVSALAATAALASVNSNAAPADFPAVGHSYEAAFSGMQFKLEFDADGKTMRFARSSEKDFKAAAESVAYTAVAIRPGVFMVYWKERSGNTVTHIEDFDNSTVYTNITLPDTTFYNLKGSWKRIG
ncbi:hypothetical protein [Chitinimonas sp.]|uniref:MoaF-related domain-containing protein n=1 Tax=Chitinimonas sp. TaxID=1934313 RepID=UPI0035B00C7B